MAVTALDPRTALIVIDLQTATSWFATAHPVRDVVRNAVQLTRAVTQVVIAGVTTSIDVESTARHAYDLGLNVTLAVDAMTDTSVVAHANSITRIFPSLGEIGTTAEIVELLDKTCSGTTP
jgi:nicotinamidase-related amidase